MYYVLVFNLNIQSLNIYLQELYRKSLYFLMDHSSLAVIVAAVIIFILYLIFRNPYRFPYYSVNLDVSGRRNVVMLDEIEKYINTNGISEFTEHRNRVDDWKEKAFKNACKSILKSLRISQYNKTIDDKALFKFNLCRKQTRYKQQNYVKTSYQVINKVETFCCDYDYIIERYNELEKIGFETTTSKYNAKNQRKMMTEELRERIKLRDNYTCQICGKYMPDGVGLQIDHITPISKGGKTVESNLQVLCSVCNGRKSNK